MNHARLALPVLAALMGLTLIGAAAADPLLEDRVARLERIMDNQSASALMLQVQQLQTEIQELRGLTETQKFQIQKLQHQLRDQYLDIDSRLGTGKGQEPPPGSTPGGGTATDTAPTTAGEGAAPPARPNGAVDVSGKDLRPPVGSEPAAPVTAPTPIPRGTTGIPSLPSPETTEGNERDAYRDAFDLLKQRKYADAVTAFNDLMRRFPQGQYSDQARYWLAETYYVQRNYPAALAEFDHLVQLNPDSARVPGALLKIGDIQSEQDAREQARAAYRLLITKYPGTTEARLAQSRLQKLAGERRPQTTP